MYAELGDKLTFEHNGVVMSLNSQADLVAWKKDRQKNWPTRERMAERFDERRRVGEERKRLLRGAEALYGTVPRPPRVPKSANVDADARPAKASNGEGVKQPETDAEKVKREMLEKNARLEELRRKVTESSARNRRLQEEGDSESPRPSSVSDRIVDTEQQKPAEAGEEPSAADPAATLNGEEQHEDVLDQVENDDPSSTSSDSTSSSSSDSSEDEAPEEMTSKAPPPPLNSGAKLKYDCKYFSASGYCRDGDACRFRHVRQPHHQLQQQKVNGMNDQQRSKGPVRKDDRPPKLDGPGEKKTIFQRWMEQEDDEADRLALQVVKFLGEKGVL